PPGIPAETRNQPCGHAENDENPGQKTDTAGEREKPAPIVKPPLSGLVLLLFLLPFLAGNAGGLSILWVARISLILVQQRRRSVNLVFGLNPQFPRSVSRRLDSVADALGVKVIAERARAGFARQLADHSHELVGCRNGFFKHHFLPASSNTAAVMAVTPVLRVGSGTGANWLECSGGSGLPVLSLSAI